jgi:hypothetical protein
MVESKSVLELGSEIHSKLHECQCHLTKTLIALLSFFGLCITAFISLLACSYNFSTYWISHIKLVHFMNSLSTQSALREQAT